jgi:hypothetical protein
MRPSQAILVLEDLRVHLVGPLYRKGVELSSRDSQTVNDVYQQWLLLAMDLGYLHPATLKRDALRLWTDMFKADVLDLNNAFAELLGKVRTQDIKGFKALCSQISTHLYSLIKDDVRDMMTSDVYSAKRLVQLFSYTSRLTLNDIDLTQQCLEDYMTTETEMDPYLPRNLIQSLNRIIKDWMKPFDPSRVHAQHGPGGVAGHGRAALQTKYKDLSYDAMLTYAFGEPVWANAPIRSSLDRISQTIFVPKSYKTFRTISMESSTLQYFQQGVLGEIDRVIEADHRLRNRIGTHDQTRNQKLARRGSIERNFATIDLSAASDSVSYDLVKAVFRGTKLYRYLITTRSSRTVLPDGRVVNLKKFAPMGSALCFPVETIIFAAICHYVTREHYVLGRYSVYGDDIIVPTQCVEDTMQVLETLGFRVNREKSFYSQDCWFRESCGGEYCDGFDVTPMKVSRKYNHSALDVQATGLISSANTAYERGYRYLRQFFLNKYRSTSVRQIKVNPIKDRKVGNYKKVKLLVLATPWFSPSALLSDNYTNYHTERRWNSDLQRIECRVHAPQSKYEGDSDELLRLRHWLESTANRIFIGDGFQSEIRRPRVLLQNCWREKPYETIDQVFIDYFTR